MQKYNQKRLAKLKNNSWNRSQPDFNEIPRLREMRIFRQQQQQNLQLMESRVKHLLKEQQNQEKKIIYTKQDIDFIIKRKTRAFVDQQYRVRFYVLNQFTKEYNQQMQKNSAYHQYNSVNQVKEQQMRKSQGFQNSQYQQKLEKLRQMEQEKKQLNERKEQMLKDLYGQNKEKHDKIYFDHLYAYYDKQKKKEETQQKAQQNYQEKVMKENEECQKMIERMQELEAQEQNLFFNLKATQNRDKTISTQRKMIIEKPIEELIVVDY